MESISINNLDSYERNGDILSILRDYWSVYIQTHDVRDVEKKEIEKALLCKQESCGYFLWKCSKCNLEHKQKLGCNSRICTSCGKRYTEQWSNSLRKKILKVPHRHIVISVPELLWFWIKEDRSRWKLYMDAAIGMLNESMSIFTHQNLRVGAIIVLHPFGKSMDFQPHLHIILTEGGFNSKKQFVHKKFLPAATLRKKWQYYVLKLFQKFGLPNSLATQCFQNYSNGFYVWVHKDSRISNPKTISAYIGRYVRHPAIANSRILSYKDKKVTFYYNDKQDDSKAIILTKSVDEFIEALLQHIPEPQFKMIRHYGVYARCLVGGYRKSLGQSSIRFNDLTVFLPKTKILCSRCGTEMTCLGFRKPKPPDLNILKNNLKNWI